MPLSDHENPAPGQFRPWESFHSQWAGAIVVHLNGMVLSERYIALPQVHLSTRVEVDAATFERAEPQTTAENGGVATAVYAPPKPPIAVAADFSAVDAIEVQIHREEGGLTLVAAIELVSPSNKDRPGNREAFLRKCATYLQEGIALIIIDLITARPGHFHAELVELLAAGTDPLVGEDEPRYAAAYRSLFTRSRGRIEAWPSRLRLGEVLPTLPLWLDYDLAVPVDLEKTYRAARESLRLPTS